jgi:hypothetical protein
MVRAVKSGTTRALKKGASSVLLPGATRAEAWEWWGLEGKPSCLRTCAAPGDLVSTQGTTLALPVAQVFCLPLWLNETDPARLTDMIRLQLEMRGLSPRGVVFDWAVVARESARTLVVVGVLPAQLPPELEAENYERFDLSARYFPLPENALTLWREQDRLVLAVTRGRALVYFQALAEATISARMVHDLICIRATLAMQEVTATLGGIALWYAATPAELAEFKALALPVKVTERPAVQPPSQAWKLVPAAVAEARKKRESRRWQKQALLIAAGVYLLFALVLDARFLLLQHRVSQLRGWQAEHAQALALVRETEGAWKELAPAVDRDVYPLEVLNQVAQSIPRDQLHLTLFEFEHDHLLIKGEAKNVADAFQFIDLLKKDPHFQGYGLEMGQPHLLPNDLAQFQIDGTRPGNRLP